MSVLELPALRANDPQGFLAALGTLALVDELCDEARLAWDGPAGPALLAAQGVDSVGDLADRLADRARELAEGDGTLLHPDLAGFPTTKVGSKGSDPMRLTPLQAEGHARAAADDERAGRPTYARWFGGPVNQCAPREPGAKELQLTPFYAPAGQQTLASNFAKSLQAVARDDAEAFRRSFLGSEVWTWGFTRRPLNGARRLGR